eukprot:2614262-Rhodomonas_salina.1
MVSSDPSSVQVRPTALRAVYCEPGTELPDCGRFRPQPPLAEPVRGPDEHALRITQLCCAR